MTELSPRARALLNSARSAAPSSRAKERGRARLAAHLASTATLSTAAASALGKGAATSPALLSGSLVPAVVASLVVGFAVGIGTMALGVGLSPSRESAPVSSAMSSAGSPRVAPRVAATAASRPSASPEPSSSPGEPALIPEPGERAAHAALRVPGAPSIARETELLAQAQRSLGSGRAAAALEALDRYDAEFPLGALREEALGARVVALCASGNVQQGQRVAGRFLQTYPASPLVGRVRAACAAGDL